MSHDFDHGTVNSISIKSENITFQPNDDLIGEGGLCFVYRVRYDNDFAVMKKLKTDVLHTNKRLESSMRREARCLRNLLHPNVVKFSGLIWEPNFHAVVFEYAAFGDLLHFIDKYILHPYLKVKLLHDVAKGVNYLHWLPKQIIHNNLKSSNILISDNVIAKITDFGMASWISFTTEILHKQPQIELIQGGTSTHLSPERWKDINVHSTKCDVYSYGILIWELYSEQIPYRSYNNEQIKLAVIDGQRPNENLLPKDMPFEMVDLMRLCWHKGPNERPDMPVVVNSLRNFLSCDPEVTNEVHASINQIINSPIIGNNEHDTNLLLLHEECNKQVVNKD